MRGANWALQHLEVATFMEPRTLNRGGDDCLYLS
jgi:hypothetical protein